MICGFGQLFLRFPLRKGKREGVGRGGRGGTGLGSVGWGGAEGTGGAGWGWGVGVGEGINGGTATSIIFVATKLLL